MGGDTKMMVVKCHKRFRLPSMDTNYFQVRLLKPDHTWPVGFLYFPKASLDKMWNWP